MYEKTLEKIALLVTLIGLISIFFVNQSYNLTKTSISDINSESLDLTVYIEGYITKVVDTESVTILNIKDGSGTITVAAFKNGNNIKYLEGQKVSVQGKVQDYKGTLEILADKINTI